MRWFVGWSLLALATALCGLGLIMSPHTTWGVEHEQVRPAVANLIAGIEAASILLLLTAGFAVFRNKANRSAWQGELFAYLLMFLLVISVLRALYILFYLT